MILIYAGAMLPKAYEPLEAIFKSINQQSLIFKNVEFYFIGTGKNSNDAAAFNIKPLAEKYGLWQTVIFEFPSRIPYLDVLVHLSQADGIFILGSTETHYTPSKSYQAVLSGKPVLAVLHNESTAVDMLKKSGAGIVLGFDGSQGIKKIESDFAITFSLFKSFAKSFTPADVDVFTFDGHSAKQVTHALVQLLNEVPT